MKIKHLLLSGLAVVLSAGMASCSKDEGEKRNTSFSVPELTASNTIQFTVRVNAREYAFVILNGGKVAVDWGDGSMTKDINPESGSEPWRVEFTHVYKKSGEYRVRIWSDELTWLSVPGLPRDYSDLEVGNCPVLKDAMFNSFTEGKTVDVNGCPVLESLNVGNWPELESVTADKCTELSNIVLYTHPKLTSIDLSKNTKLQSLQLSDCALEEMKLPKSVSHIDCRKNDFESLSLKDYTELKSLKCFDNKKLKSLDLTGCDKLTSLYFNGTAVSGFDFSALPALTVVNCSDTELTAVDVSDNEGLGVLTCANLGLTSLDISGNANLQALDCSGNKLASLNVSANKAFRQLHINNNQFDKAGLEAVFTDLPAFDPSKATRSTMPRPEPSKIRIYGNPGAADCDQTIITKKGWIIDNTGYKPES